MYSREIMNSALALLMVIPLQPKTDMIKFHSRISSIKLYKFRIFKSLNICDSYSYILIATSASIGLNLSKHTQLKTITQERVLIEVNYIHVLKLTLYA